MGRVAITGLGFHDRDRIIAPVTQDVIGPLLHFSRGFPTNRDNAPIREGHLLTDLVVVPTSRVEFRNNVSSASVSFGRHYFSLEINSLAI